MLILGALDKTTRHYSTPDNAKRGVEYICIDCEQRVILRKGAKRRVHFAHYNAETKCTYYSPHQNESQIHKDCKYKLAEWLRNKEEIQLHDQCLGCGIMPARNEEGEFEYKENDVVIVEYRDPNNKYVADVAVLNDNKVRYIFEIKHTHRTPTNVRPEPWMEIDTKDMLETEEGIRKDEEGEPKEKHRIWHALTCIRDIDLNYCSNCAAKKEGWLENVPVLLKNMVKKKCGLKINHVLNVKEFSITPNLPVGIDRSVKYVLASIMMN